MGRDFAAVQSVRGEEPLIIDLIGPPGGGKTVSALRLALGMQRVRKGPIVLIDTDGGRSKKYSPEAGKPADPANLVFDFLRVDFAPPFRSPYFLEAIQAQLRLNPAAIIVDNFSEEHEGEGGYLEWHDEEIPKMGNNEWAAWSKPKAGRKRLMSGLNQIKIPIIRTFRAREKTITEKGKGKGGKDLITNVGWMPIAPLELIHGADLTCLLPPRANGVPVWASDKVGEDFIVKLPAFLAPLIKAGALSEDTGEALARWAAGTPAQAPRDGKGDSRVLLLNINGILQQVDSHEQKVALLAVGFPGKTWAQVQKLSPEELTVGRDAIRAHHQAQVALEDVLVDQDQVFEILGLARAAGIESSALQARFGPIHQLPASRFEEVKAQLVGNPAEVPDQQAQATLAL